MTEAGRSPERRERLFFALDLPQPLRAALHDVAERAAATDSGLRAVAGARLHVTVLFLGEVSRGLVPGLGAVLMELVPRRVELSVSGFAGLPRGRPRLFAAELAAPGAAVLRAELVARLEDAGLPYGDREALERPFWPHVTVLRARGGRSPIVVPEALGAGARGIDRHHDAVRVCLYRSNKSSGGPSDGGYEPLAGLELPTGRTGGPDRNPEVIEP
ncbi:RNA 2',3'-cyclic phosphodiesterase [Thermoleophilia bacterium SCSIO 60948]|nr:RNA 2',3'-cyclic phosphodiesterase [Thermoleophilia bacterium SCSIO 60948]